MLRNALLVALVVCNLGVAFAAVQPASADVLSTTPTPDGSSDQPEDPDDSEAESDGSDDDSERSARTTGPSGNGSGSDDADERGRWSRSWGSDGDDRDGGSDGRDRDDGWEDDEPGDYGETDASDDSDGGEGETAERDRSNETDGEAEEADGRDERDERNRSLGVVDSVTSLTTESLEGVAEGTGGDRDDDLDRGHRSDVLDGSLGLREATDEATDDVPDVGIDVGVDRVIDVGIGGEIESGPNASLVVDGDRERLRAVNLTVTGGLLVPLPPALVGQPEGGEPDDRPSAPVTPAEMGIGEPAAADAESGYGEPRGPPSGPPLEAGVPAVDDGGIDESGSDGGDAPGSGSGAGAALLVTVGCLGGTRTALDGAATFAASGPRPALATLRQTVAAHLRGVADHVVPAVFGYSRCDGSDPLENDTRAEIYDLVRDSPGTYHAQIAAEADVTEETVRYHARILSEEGLVETRKHRGRRRLYPVTLDDDDPELAAAIADSAASEVLSAIRRREPASVSSVADALDCAPSTVSYHLDRLEEDGLVTRERDGGSVNVRLRRSTRSVLDGSVADD